MKNIFILLMLGSLLLSSCAGLRVEKRRYSSGWYVNSERETVREGERERETERGKSSVSLGVSVEEKGERETERERVRGKSSVSELKERETVRGKSSGSLGASVEEKGERETVRERERERERERGKSSVSELKERETVQGKSSGSLGASVEEKGERETVRERETAFSPLRPIGKRDFVLQKQFKKVEQSPRYSDKKKEHIGSSVVQEKGSVKSKPVDNERKKKNTFQILLAASLLALLGAIMIVTTGLSPVLFLALAVTGVVLLVVAILNRPKRTAQINTEPISEPIDPNYKKGSNDAINKAAKPVVLIIAGLILGFFLFAGILIYTILLQFL